MTRLKYVADLVAGQSPPSEDVELLGEGQPFLQGNAEFGPTHPTPRYECSVPPKQCEPGDILLSVRAPVGAVNIADRTYGIGRGLCAIRPRSAVPDYLRWWLLHSRTELEVLATGSTFAAVSAPVVGGLELPVLDPTQQRAIADYLDRETARIDTLIEEQQRLIETLRLRRRSVVDAALSQGLDSEAGLSETGNPWLPKLPDGWKAVRTKRVLSFGPANGVSPAAGDTDDLKSLSLGAIRDGRVLMGPEVTKFVDRSSLASTEALRLHPGDILLVRGNGNVDLVARAGLVGPEFAAEEYIYPDLLIRVRVNSSMLPEFFVWACNASATRAQVRAQARTAVGTFKVAGGDVRSLFLPLPPLDEQRAIAAYLDEQTAKIDMLIAEAERFIELARERRAALITAAVTGQIDVREMV